MLIYLSKNICFGGRIKRSIYNPDVGIIEIKTQNEYNNLKRHSINHFYEKLFLLKDLMNTDSARKIAERREKFMTTYIEEFMLEWNCEEEIC